MKTLRATVCFSVVLFLVACSSSRNDPIDGAWVNEHGGKGTLFVYKTNGRFSLTELRNKILGPDRVGEWKRAGNRLELFFYDEEGRTGAGIPIRIELTDTVLTILSESEHVPSGKYRRVRWTESEPLDTIIHRL